MNDPILSGFHPLGTPIGYVRTHVWRYAANEVRFDCAQRAHIRRPKRLQHIGEFGVALPVEVAQQFAIVQIALEYEQMRLRQVCVQIGRAALHGIVAEWARPEQFGGAQFDLMLFDVSAHASPEFADIGRLAVGQPLDGPVKVAGHHVRYEPRDCLAVQAYRGRKVVANQEIGQHQIGEQLVAGIVQDEVDAGPWAAGRQAVVYVGRVIGQNGFVQCFDGVERIVVGLDVLAA